MFATISLVVDPAILARFDRIAEARGTSRSALVRALMENLVSSEEVPFTPNGGYTEPPPAPLVPLKSLSAVVTPGCNVGLVKLPDGTVITREEWDDRVLRRRRLSSQRETRDEDVEFDPAAFDAGLDAEDRGGDE